MTFEKPLAQSETFPAHETIRLAREEDLPALREIARNTHRDTRFYFDGHFDRDKCDQLYETWIENSFRGFAQAILVAEVANAPAAYLTCHLKGERVADWPAGCRFATSGPRTGHKTRAAVFDMVTRAECSARHRCHARTQPRSAATVSAQPFRYRLFTTVVSPLVFAMTLARPR